MVFATGTTEEEEGRSVQQKLGQSLQKSDYEMLPMLEKA